MQNTQAFPDWVFQVLQALAWLGAGGTIVKLITLWQNRRKPVVEIQKVEAETTAITVKSHAVVGDALLRMMDRLEEALNTNDKMRSRCYDLEEENDKQKLELESYNRQMEHMRAVMEINGLNYDGPVKRLGGSDAGNDSK